MEVGTALVVVGVIYLMVVSRGFHVCDPDQGCGVVGVLVFVRLMWPASLPAAAPAPLRPWARRSVPTRRHDRCGPESPCHYTAPDKTRTFRHPWHIHFEGINRRKPRP
jgi:hypothetical protein